MPHSDFVHLRTHTAYSLAEGAIRIKQLVKMCQAEAMPAVGVADTGNLFGALELSSACAEAGIQPIIGVQLAIRREEEPNRGFGGIEKKPEPDQLVLLAQSEAGYLNLLKLVSKAFMETEAPETPQVSLEDIEHRSADVIVLTGGVLGGVGRLLGEGHDARAEALLLRLAAAFPGRLYVELQRHGLEIEDRIEPGLIDLAYKHDLPLVATNEPFFSDAGMYQAHDALLCIAAGAYVSQDDRRRLTPEHRFKSAAEMQALFADLPEAVDNTLVVAQRCAYMVKKRKPILPPFRVEGKTEEEMLRVQTLEGLELRLEKHIFTPEMSQEEREAAAKPYRERVEYELGTIVQMGFPGYFLIVADFIQWGKAHGVPVGPGRGSGAGSAVAWALTITDLDPLRWGLLFERFLNPERVSMPDFDIDFCQDKREQVIRYVQRRYGQDQVAQIITFGKLQARAVLRDVGRVLQMPYGQVDRLCKMVPNNPADPITLKDAIEREPLLKEMQKSDEQVAHLLDMGMKLEGLYRHASTHAAGVVIGDRPLDELVPLYRDPRSDMPVTQFNMKWVEAAGLVKFDFLGLKTLTVLYRAVENVKRTTGIEIDLAAIPLDDEKTFQMLARGETVGVFQLESTGMRDTVRKMRADRFEDIIAIVALYRPGPMDNIPHYIAVKHGEEAADYMHPRLEGILKETHGIMIYQEQVMQIAQELSGYSLGGADLLRRAMGKKIQAEMDAQRKLFVDGAVARGVAEGKASEIFDQVNKFAGYGFNKSHAAAYALVSYHTAYLKANYPVEFTAASMTYDMHNTDKLNVFRQDMDRFKIKLLPPDINKSGPDFWVEQTPDGLAVRYALAALKNVGAAAMEALVAERKKNGPFKSMADFSKRVDGKAINKRQMENLVRAGAFDTLEPNRAKLFDGIETVMKEAASSASERETGQSSLFGGGDVAPTLVIANRIEWPPMEKLQNEFEAIGFFLSAHPLDAFAKSMKRIGVLTIAELPKHLSGGGKSRVRLAGLLNSKQERVSSRGSKYAFLTISDATGMFEVMIFSEVLAASRDLLQTNTPLLLTVEARLEEDQLKLTGQVIESLDEAAAKASAGLKIVIKDQNSLAAAERTGRQGSARQRPHRAGGAKRGARGRSLATGRLRPVASHDWRLAHASGRGRGAGDLIEVGRPRAVISARGFLHHGVTVRINVVFSILLLSLTLAGTAFAADPPPKKKPTYPPPEQSNTIGSLGKPRDPNAPALPRESAAPQAAPVIPKVEAEPPTPLTSPDRVEVHSEGGQMPGGTIGAAPMAARVPVGPPPTGFLPDHPFVSGIVAGLIGSDLGAKLYGGPMMGDQDGVMVGYVARVGVILLLAWMIFRLIARRASHSGEEMPRVASGGRREPSFNRGADADAGRGRREPKFDRNSR